jgi:hypothetical protein
MENFLSKRRSFSLLGKEAFGEISFSLSAPDEDKGERERESDRFDDRVSIGNDEACREKGFSAETRSFFAGESFFFFLFPLSLLLTQSSSSSTFTKK